MVFIVDEDVILVLEIEVVICINDCSVGIECLFEVIVKYVLKLLVSVLLVIDNVDDSDDEDSIELNVKIGRLGIFFKSLV